MRAASPLTPTPTMFTAVPTRFASCAVHHRAGASGRSSSCHPHALATGDRRFTANAAPSSHRLTPTRAAPVSCHGNFRTTRSASPAPRSEEHTSELQSRLHLVCRLLLEKKKKKEKTRKEKTKKKKEKKEE